jgi:hypothetical protein
VIWSRGSIQPSLRVNKFKVELNIRSEKETHHAILDDSDARIRRAQVDANCRGLLSSDDGVNGHFSRF